MTKMHHLLLAFSISLLIQQPVTAAIYKCQSDNGKTVYSGKPCGKTKQVLELKKENKFQLNTPGNNNSKVQESDYDPDVTVYITSWCPYCKKTMAYLDANYIPYTAYDIEQDLDAKAAKEKLTPGYTGIPVTVINGHIIKGYNVEKFERALYR